ncbi:MAG: phosphoglycerate dehydrogenase [Alphaproteobacteria bacterium]|nr:phosphoglycerate dehydrogenase [Alphaproteobacteria bacterium]
MPRIAVTSRVFTMLPHLKEELLARHPDAIFNAEKYRFTEDELIAFLDGCEIALIGLDPITERVLAALPKLRVVAACSVGADHIDPAAMKRHGVRLGWKPGVNKVSVAELTISLMINLLRKIHTYNRETLAGRWPANRMGLHLRGRTVGLHGCGHVGQEVARLLQPFGATLLAADRQDYPEAFRALGITRVAADELWARAEILSIHLPRNSTTIGLYTAAVLDRLRPGILLVNTARGRIVDEAALRERLLDGRIAAAAFDVFAEEPLVDLSLAALPNFVATPHIGGSAREAWEAMARAGMAGITENAVPEPGRYPFD